MKVILIVVPETLYHEILTKNFSNRLFELQLKSFTQMRRRDLFSNATSILAMETNHVLEAAKDAGGGRVIDCVLISAKQLCRFLYKLREHFQYTRQALL
ncbi:hypothetical protein MKW98_005799 [Papaver atlanticum]|uniref:Uncharacterized protein n=1 Tax=Papaver atlanticum TaxID=357466 RepID=A0AAD4TL35_9MAGN|nr:hypothetical protein MKW98_005799 [Papaver atlanticum]